MTNEQYLYISYFAAVVGTGLAAVIAAALARPNRRATIGPILKWLGAIMRRVLPVWLLLAVLLGFMSVSYIDCGHPNYSDVVADHPHMVQKTQEQVSRMTLGLVAVLVAYSFLLILFLWARARRMRGKPG